MKTLLWLCLVWAKWRLRVAERYDREMFRLYEEVDRAGNMTLARFRGNMSGKYERWVGRCKRRVAHIDSRLQSRIASGRNATPLAC